MSQAEVSKNERASLQISTKSLEAPDARQTEISKSEQQSPQDFGPPSDDLLRIVNEIEKGNFEGILLLGKATDLNDVVAAKKFLPQYAAEHSQNAELANLALAKLGSQKHRHALEELLNSGHSESEAIQSFAYIGGRYGAEQLFSVLIESPTEQQPQLSAKPHSDQARLLASWALAQIINDPPVMSGKSTHDRSDLRAWEKWYLINKKTYLMAPCCGP